jgi:protein-tyrosine phosphatase
MSAELTPTRHVPLEGTFNTRDIGGYVTTDGRRTRWGRFLRSDSLHRLSEKDQRVLLDYGIRTVIDLRRSAEMQQQVNVFFGSDEVTYYHHNMVGDIPMRERQNLPQGLEEVERKRWGYSVVLDKRQPEVRDTLCALAAPEALPALVHCAGGADRTGLITALVLGIAGVPAETISQDYALTARFNLPRYLDSHPEIDATTYTWQDFQRDTCDPGVMLGVLRDLNLRHCGVEGYLLDSGVSPAEITALRGALIE